MRSSHRITRDHPMESLVGCDQRCLQPDRKRRMRLLFGARLHLRRPTRRNSRRKSPPHSTDALLSDADRAAVRVARALSVIPAEIREDDRRALRRHFSTANEEWIVLAVAMMGWLNKTMDGRGVPLEAPTVAEVNGLIAASGWTPGKHMNGGLPSATPPPRADSLGTRFGMIRHAPNAISLDKQWTKGVPNRWPTAGEFLRKTTGHDFPVLGRLRHRSAIRPTADDDARQLLRERRRTGREAERGAGLRGRRAQRSALPISCERQAQPRPPSHRCRR